MNESQDRINFRKYARGVTVSPKQFSFFGSMSDLSNGGGWFVIADSSVKNRLLNTSRNGAAL